MTRATRVLARTVLRCVSLSGGRVDGWMGVWEEEREEGERGEGKKGGGRRERERQKERERDGSGRERRERFSPYFKFS